MAQKSKYAPSLDASRVLACDTSGHDSITRRVLREIVKPGSRRGVSREVAEAEARAAGWLVDAFCQCQGHVPSVPLSLARTRAVYTAAAGSRQLPFGYNLIGRVLQGFRSLGWIEEIIGTVQRGYTLIWPVGELGVYCRREGMRWRRRSPPEPGDLIVVTEKLGDKKVHRSVSDEASPRVAAWRSNLMTINAFLVEQCIYLRATDAQLESLAVELRARGKDGRPRLIHFGKVALRRIFTGDLARGGRFYGGWWQNAPREARDHIWINEWRGLECDYSGMAIRCLYASEGLSPPEDPYDIGLPGYSGAADPRRGIVKDYVNAILNDANKKHRVSPERLRTLGLTQAELLARVTKTHSRVKHHFWTDAGSRMQLVDSDIAERVMLRLMKRSIVCLPIHDSFIVQAPFVRELQDAMEASFEEVTGRQARLKWSVPAMGEHFGDHLLTPVEVRDPAALRARIASEYNRFSSANEYFGSWADQQWGREGWEQAFAILDRLWKAGAHPSMLRLHAFPAPLLHTLYQR